MTGLPDQDTGGGLNERAGAPALDEDPGGTGGASGGGTISGEGQPTGGTLDHAGGEAGSSDPLVAAGADSLASRSGSEVAAEAAALGQVDGTLADASGGDAPWVPGSGPVGGETLRTGSGRGEVGSGTPADHGELGGGAPLGQHGGPGPAGARSPGGHDAG